MRPSIVQLKQVVFQRILVEAAKEVDELVAGEAVNFDFDGVNMKVRHRFGVTQPKEDGTPSKAFLVILGFTIDNIEGKPAPYKIDVEALGFIEVVGDHETATPEDLAVVNGTSVVYGAVREMVTNLTSRFAPGALVLPTMDFRDHLKHREKVQFTEKHTTG